jgi:RND family efflux transporter MFP subunit
MSYTIKAATLIAGFSLVLLSSCSNAPEKENKNTDTPISVTAATPRMNSQQGIYASGKVEAAETANISTRVMGYITKIQVKVGDRVQKGQLLATISNDDIMAKKAQAEAQYTLAQSAFINAEKDYQRFTELHQQSSASDKELENITLQYNSAKAQVETAKQMRNEVNAMLAYTNLTAPFSGVVTQKLMDAGSIASPGMPLLVMEQSTGFQVRATVTENEIDKIRKGTSASILIKSTGKEITGKVTEISQSSQFTGGQYQINIDISNTDQSGIYTGMYVNIFIPVEEKATAETETGNPLIPVASLITRDQLTGLYTISDNKTALLRWVRLGKTIGNEVEVLSGLSRDEKFITHAEGKLYNGAKVIVTN